MIPDCYTITTVLTVILSQEYDPWLAVPNCMNNICMTSLLTITWNTIKLCTCFIVHIKQILLKLLHFDQSKLRKGKKNCIWNIKEPQYQNENMFLEKEVTMQCCSSLFCQTPDLGLGLGVDFTFPNNNNNNKNNPQLIFHRREATRVWNMAHRLIGFRHLRISRFMGLWI